ncbi:rhomboid family intramembrane serine protease [Chitinispirillales bacterium ANBcel5]|uniref:rhomboid family intramembrane serine protease n=1 Tax=Cellulosispirillum alkaliphilum TaxID=3039283 RepID=UPI002A511288|nr:rhomboid family intramembrane serine protease [Chitinispirillales bacterium ANBcel5]
MRYHGYSTTGRALRALLIANVAVYLLQLLPGIGTFVFDFGSLVPYETFLQGQLWRTVTYMFLHSTTSIFHILFNMLVLYMFGMDLESHWGPRRFLTFYFICGIGAAFFSLFSLLDPAGRSIHVIGASGAVLGVLTACAYYWPDRQILLFFIIPIKIKYFVIGFAVYSLFGSIGPAGGGISHLSHLGGIAVGYGYLKSYSHLYGWYIRVINSWNQRKRTANVQGQVNRKRYFEEQVDPILEKIAREGMDSLSPSEKKTLKKAAKMDKERLKKKGILPFNLFR